MSSKFNTDFLKGVATPAVGKDVTPSVSNDTLSKFKKTSDIFDKAKASIESLQLDRLLPYSKHPFKIRDNDRLRELTESIEEQGILVPLIVRVHPERKGYYEILAGHHRHAGAERVGLIDIPCIIKNVDDNTAALIVVESNKQRGFADMLPSEIAFALKLEYDALKSQGKRTDLTTEIEEILQQENAYKYDNGGVYSTSAPVEQKLESGQKVAEKNDMSSANVRRYIRLTFLTSPLLDLVDNQDIAIRPAVDLSYLKQSEQEIVLNLLETSSYKIDMKIAEKLKEYSQVGKLNDTTASSILSGEVFDKKVKPTAKDVKLPIKRIKEYIPSSITPQEELNNHIACLTERFSHWNHLYENGGQDPFWSDGSNLNLVHNHIIYYKQQIKELCDSNSFDLPEIYFTDAPQEVDDGYMAKADEIYKNGKDLLLQLENEYDIEKYKTDSTAYKQYIILKNAINKTDLVSIRRYTLKRFTDYLKPSEIKIHDYAEANSGQLGFYNENTLVKKSNIFASEKLSCLSTTEH